MWEHGLLVQVPKGVVLEQPFYVRIDDVEDGSLFWRLLIDAGPESRFTVIEEYASTSPELAGDHAAVEIFVGQGAKVEYVSVQNVSRETWHFGRITRASTATPSSTGSPGVRLQARQDQDPERSRRPGRHVPRDGRVLRRRSQHLD